MMRLLFALLAGLLPLLAQPRFDLPVSWIAPGPAASGILYAYAGGTLFRTSDGGQSWSAISVREPGSPQPELSGLLVTASSPAVIYALGRTRDGAVWKSNDSGRTWNTVNFGLPDSTEPIQDAFMDLNDPNIIYLRIGSEVFRTANGGAGWARISTLSPAGPYLAFIASPANRRTVYYANSGSVFQSTNEGATWTAVYAAPGSRPLLAVAVDRLNSDFVLTSYAGSVTGPADFQTAVVRSTDSGINWNPVTHPGTALQRLLVASGNIYYGLTADGALVRTANAANTWSATPAGFATTLAPDPMNPSIVYAGSNGVSRSTDAGATFTPLLGTVRPNLATPGPVSFRLRLGDSASIQIPVRALENPQWQIAFQSTASEPWLRWSAAGGNTPTTLALTVDAGGLTPGAYTAQARIVSEQASAPLIIPVTIAVDAPGASGPQFSLNSVGEADAPSAITADSQNNVFSASGTAIFRIDPAGAAARLTTLAGVTGLLAAPDGSIHLARPTPPVVQRLVNGTVSTLFTEADARAAGVASFAPSRVRFDAQGRLLVAASGAIVRFSPSANPPIALLVSAPQGADFADVAADPAGNLYIADRARHAILRWDPAAARLEAIAGRPGVAGFSGDGGPALEALLNSPRAVQRGADGALYIADSGNHAVRVITPDSRIFTITGRDALRSPSDLALEPSGDLLAADLGNNRVARLTALRNLPEISRNGFVNAAGNRPFLSPGSLFSIYGANLSMHHEVAGSAPWPTRLGDSSVTINGRPAPLFFVSGNQINGQVPFEIQPGPAAAVVSSGALTSAPSTTPVLPAAPGILIYGEDRAVAVNPSGAINGPGAAAAPGQEISVYLTGIGPLDQAVPTGAAAPLDSLARAASPHRATLGGRECEVTFLGLAPGFVGLAQANLRIPSGPPPGDSTLVITVNGVESNPARVAVGN